MKGQIFKIGFSKYLLIKSPIISNSTYNIIVSINKIIASINKIIAS